MFKLFAVILAGCCKLLRKVFFKWFSQFLCAAFWTSVLNEYPLYIKILLKIRFYFFYHFNKHKWKVCLRSLLTHGIMVIFMHIFKHSSKFTEWIWLFCLNTLNLWLSENSAVEMSEFRKKCLLFVHVCIKISPKVRHILI